MVGLTVIIPSKNEKFLNETIRDVLKNATGEIEIIPVLDGYEPPELIKDARVRYLYLEPTSYTKKRHGINQAVEMAKGEYIMSLDAHCMMAKGFDTQLIKDHQPNWVQVPRRHRLDAENWCLQPQSDNRPPIDYEYIMFDKLVKYKNIHGFKWDSKTLERMDTMIDETMTMQASCWFMTKAWFKERGFMKIEGYTGWGQEAEEISFETWKNGGKLMVNKNTWYAHLHKGPKYGRMYFMNKNENKRSYEYAYNYWVIENREFFVQFINKFKPPMWEDSWEEIVYGTTN